MKTKCLLLFFASCNLINANTIATANDSIQNTDRTTVFNPKQLILPVSLITIGAWGICNGWMQSINHSINSDMAKLRNNTYFHIDDYIQYVPVISHIGLNALGVKSQHNFKERLAITATAYLAMGIMVNGTKFLVNEKRPDSGARNSFPSGHTATAFMGAELVRMEYGNKIYGWSAYAIAGSVAFLRIYNNRHWLNDVIAGAGVGVLSARIGYWLLPLNQKIFKLNNSQRLVTAIPTYDYQNHNFSIALYANF